MKIARLKKSIAGAFAALAILSFTFTVQVFGVVQVKGAKVQVSVQQGVVGGRVGIVTHIVGVGTTAVG